MKEEKGITLVALILTVVVLFIIASISITSGTESIEDTRLQGFYMQLDIVKKRVDDIATTNESYIDKSGKTVYIKEQGANLTSAQKISLKNILISEGLNDLELDSFVNEFRYFRIQDLENIMDLSEIDYDVFINFENRVVIAEKGLETVDKTYYVPKNTTYFVEQDANKNVGTITTLNYSEPTEYGDNTYKVKITSNIIGDLDGSGYVKYKKTTTKYWEISNNTEVVLELNVEYNIEYYDSNNNSLAKKVKLETDDTGNLTVTEI